MKMLRGSREPIADIAFACGFGSISRFYVGFRKHAEITPSQYREGAAPLRAFVSEDVLRTLAEETVESEGANRACQ